MKIVFRSLIALSICASSAWADPPPDRPATLLGTTGACNNLVPGGTCTQTSTLVQLDSRTGAFVRTIGPVGFTVNGLAWDRTSKTLYATTAIGDTTFHGLITIDPFTGAGTPVDSSVINFGLPGNSPIHSLAIDFFGNMVAWYDEFPPPAGVTDTFVTIDKNTGIATEFPNTGINTGNNGLAFTSLAAAGVLWNIDTTRLHADGTTTQTAYLIDPLSGKPLSSVQLSPPTPAALGDFNPKDHLYWGLNFTPFTIDPHTFIVVVDVNAGTVSTLCETLPDLHVLAFVSTH
jgi:hypothetical protein